MNKLRRNFNRFVYKNRNKGIPNLMLYIGIGNLIVYFFSRYDDGLQMYNWFCFDAAKILHGQVWRLLSLIHICFHLRHHHGPAAVLYAGL